MEERAQVSIEYLLMALFGITLAIIAAIVLDSIRGVALSAQGEILDYRDSAIAALLQAP
ncbi:MAG: hypothetical protein JW744_05975 [Candidatus Diapherotrites archaeon]|uniref:Class III signal peptide-containing protein n=1 Tax=Candidatus Iainarchaeum sp. TaxID=3101447 RepID=A0A938YPN9_9ARCH|nr:hypothetical protein [Candidatus Diapherotrites archaeon]